MNDASILLYAKTAARRNAPMCSISMFKKDGLLFFSIYNNGQIHEVTMHEEISNDLRLLQDYFYGIGFALQEIPVLSDDIRDTIQKHHIGIQRENCLKCAQYCT